MIKIHRLRHQQNRRKNIQMTSFT